MKTLAQYIAEYQPTQEHNDQLFAEFATLTDKVPFLKAHRDWVEKNRWGFGDRPYHYMWYLLLTQKVLRRDKPRLLEIGVYKGQVISLWCLIALRQGVGINISAVSPLSGTKPKLEILHKALFRLSSSYRKMVWQGDLYPQSDYLSDIQKIFRKFLADMSQVELLRGRSQDRQIQASLAGKQFDVVYIDGAHSYEEVRQDIRFYGEMVEPGGYLVMDDAAFFQPATLFWKGHEEVSLAAEEIDKNKFANVLNVGHNRIYRRL